MENSTQVEDPDIELAQGIGWGADEDWGDDDYDAWEAGEYYQDEETGHASQTALSGNVVQAQPMLNITSPGDVKVEVTVAREPLPPGVGFDGVAPEPPDPYPLVLENLIPDGLTLVKKKDLEHLKKKRHELKRLSALKLDLPHFHRDLYEQKLEALTHDVADLRCFEKALAKAEMEASERRFQELRDEGLAAEQRMLGRKRADKNFS